MKSFFLSPITSADTASAVLTELLEGQVEPWILMADKGDPVAYFSVVQSDSTTFLPTIQADISGRHYNEDEAVLKILRKLQKEVGGEITCAP